VKVSADRQPCRERLLSHLLCPKAFLAHTQLSSINTNFLKPYHNNVPDTLTMSSKILTLRYNDNVFSKRIAADMTEDEIYKELREAVWEDHIDIGDFAITIMDPTRNNELVYLEYTRLKTNITYEIGTSVHRIQGPSTMSKSSQRTAKNLAVIQEHWGLTDPTHIFSPELSPGEANPYNWPYCFTDTLRTLSGRTQGQHEEAMALLEAQAKARDMREDEAVRGVTSDDIRRAVKTRAKTVAEKANELVEEEEDRVNTAVFSGGLGLAAEQALEESEGALVGTAYEQDGKFKIAAVGSKKQPWA
jgi:hypothetical protein